MFDPLNQQDRSQGHHFLNHLLLVYMKTFGTIPPGKDQWSNATPMGPLVYHGPLLCSPPNLGVAWRCAIDPDSPKGLNSPCLDVPGS